MRRRTVLAGLGAGALAAATARAEEGDPPAALEGVWGGLLVAGAQRLRLRLDIGAGDRPTVLLTSIDQGGAEIPGEGARIVADRLTARFPAVSGALDVTLDADGALVGEWSQGAALAIIFMRDPDWAALAADAPPATPLDAAGLAALRAQAGAPAMIAAARRGGGPPVVLVDGVRAARRDDPAQAGDAWHLGSITKSMTATLVAQAVEADVLAWETTLGEAFGDLAPDMRPAYRGATLHQLLTHRAGLAANVSMIRFATFPREEADARASRARWVQAALGQEPGGPPGEAFAYSNNGYVLAGHMLERRLNAPWEALIAERLFAPLGLESAGFGAPGRTEDGGQDPAPLGHSAGLMGRLKAHRSGASVVDNPAVMGPAGRVHMSMADLLAYLAAHRDRADLLTAASWDRLHTPPAGGDYACGWEVGPEGRLRHNGSNTLWYAEATVDRGAGVVAAAAVNLGDVAKVAAPTGEAMLRATAAV